MRHLILMRGVPGSGKSFEARRLAAGAEAAGHTVAIHSTDDFFLTTGDDGKPVYRFDGDRIVEYHGRNQLAVLTAIQAQINTIIVDNTNVYSRDIRPLIEAGFLADYRISLHEPTSDWWLAVRDKIGTVRDNRQCEALAREFYERNTHSVPIRSIVKMLIRWENEDSLDADLREMIGACHD